MESIFSHAGSWLGLLGSVGLTLATYLANRYVIPFLRIGKRQQYALYIGNIADDVTDELRGKYPQKEWLKHLDEAIDTLMMICGITSDIARRAIRACRVFSKFMLLSPAINSRAGHWSRIDNSYSRRYHLCSQHHRNCSRPVPRHRWEVDLRP